MFTHLSLLFLSCINSKIIAISPNNLQTRRNQVNQYHITTFVSNIDMFLTNVSKIEFYYFGYKCVKINDSIIYNKTNLLHIICNQSEQNYPPIMILSRMNTSLSNQCYFGKLFNIFEENFNLSYEVIPCKENQFGALLNGKWTGMMNDVVKGFVDLAPGIIITRQRSDYVNFSPELTRMQFEILYRKINLQELNFTFFLKPFSKEIWICTFAISSLIILVNIFVSAGLRRHFLHYLPIIIKELLLCWPIIFQGNFQFFTIHSLKFFYGTYIIFSMIILISYSSVLTSLLATTNIKIPFISLEDMLMNTNYLPVVLKGSKIEEIFLTPTYQRKQILRAGSPREALEAIYTMKAGYLTPLVEIKHIIHEPCRFSLAPKYVSRDIVSFAYAKKFVYADYFNYKFLLLKETGVLIRVYKQHIPDWPKCAANPFHPVPFGQIIGLLVFITSGILISLLIGVLELITYKFYY